MHDASAPARDVVWNAGHRKGSAVVELDEATLKRVALVVPRKEVSPRDLPPLAALSSDPPADAVVGKDMRRYHSTSLFCLKVHHPFRRTAIRIVESPPFDPIILITIICNCATMGWESPLDPEGTPKAHFIAVCEWVYLIIFTFELLSKVVAYGFAMHSDSYLRDAWCQLDFTVVTLAWIPILFPSFGNYSVIRSVRALRPLRALARAGMPVLVSSVLASLPGLASSASSAASCSSSSASSGSSFSRAPSTAARSPASPTSSPSAARSEEAQFDSGVLCVMDAASAAVQGRMLRGGGGGGGGSGGGLSSLAPCARRASLTRAPFSHYPRRGEGGTFSQHPSTSPDLSHPPPFPASQEAQAAPTSRCARTSRRRSTASRRSTTSAGRSSSSCRR